MIGTRETTGGADGVTIVSSSAVVGDFSERFRKRRGGVVGNGGGVGGASPAAAMRRPTTKIAIPPRMYGVSDTGA